MINSVCLMGRMVADAELRVTTNGKSVASFTIAVDRNQKEKKTDFINIVAWEHNSKFVSDYFHKGDMIAIEGSIQTRNYEDSNGNKRTAFEVVAKIISFCGGKNNTENKPAPNIDADPFADFEEI